MQRSGKDGKPWSQGKDGKQTSSSSEHEERSANELAAGVAVGVGAVGLLALGAAYLFGGKGQQQDGGKGQKSLEASSQEELHGGFLKTWKKIESKIKQHPEIQYDKTEYASLKEIRNSLVHNEDFRADKSMVTRCQTFADRL
jgi:hypothetical protein